jgi:hypothetical protein
MDDEALEMARAKTIEVFGALRDGAQPFDSEFDGIFSRETRRLSSTHWTPVLVSLCAARMLAKTPDAKILDVGCGPGKL